MAKGNFSQTLSQTLTLTNQTARDFAFEMVAEDVVIKEGKRVFVPAGETPNSIAASAVFTQKTVLVKPFSAASVDVRVTLPAETDSAPWLPCFAERISCPFLPAQLA